MADINEIIRALDKFLNETGRENLGAPEANAELNRLGLLEDSASRPGLPLRRLLRKKYLPHAYKDGVNWVIPKSSNEPTTTSVTIPPRRKRRKSASRRRIVTKKIKKGGITRWTTIPPPPDEEGLLP